MKHENVPTMSWGEFVGMIVTGIGYAVVFVFVTLRMLLSLPLWILLALYLVIMWLKPH